MHPEIRTIGIATKDHYFYNGLHHFLSQKGYKVVYLSGAVRLCDAYIYNAYESTDIDIQKKIKAIRAKATGNNLYTITFAPPHVSTAVSCDPKKILVSNKLAGDELCSLIKKIDSRKEVMPDLSDLEKKIIDLYLCGNTTKQISYCLGKPLKSVYSIRKRALTKMKLPNFNALAQAYNFL